MKGQMTGSVTEKVYTEMTFKALVDAILPITRLDSKITGGQPQSYRASDLQIHQYVMFALDHYITVQQQLFQTRIPLSYPTALMLDIAASFLPHLSNETQTKNQGLFATLSKKDRIRTLSLLENIEIDLYLLPNPYHNNAGLVQYMADALNRLTMLGFYSEWAAYGKTRDEPPQVRQLQYFPIGWMEAQYPGVSYGYRDFRGFLLKMGRTEANDESSL